MKKKTDLILQKRDEINAFVNELPNDFAGIFWFLDKRDGQVASTSNCSDSDRLEAILGISRHILQSLFDGVKK